jgi:PKD repeat protein
VVFLNFTGTSGAITIEFQTGAYNISSYNNEGFGAKWTSTKNNDGPLVADFTINKLYKDTIFECNGGTTVGFTNKSHQSRVVKGAQWIFDYNPFVIYPPSFSNSTAMNPTYSYSTTGVKNVRLVSESCEGFDTVVKTFVIASSTMLPIVDFKADAQLFFHLVEQHGSEVILLQNVLVTGLLFLQLIRLSADHLPVMQFRLNSTRLHVIT